RIVSRIRSCFFINDGTPMNFASRVRTHKNKSLGCTKFIRSLAGSGALCTVVAVISAPGWSTAATISSITAVWPTTPNVQTLDANSVATHANRGISTTRVDRQSFRVDSDVTINSIYLSANAYNNLAFNIGFFSLANSLSNTSADWTGATQIGSTITV